MSAPVWGRLKETGHLRDLGEDMSEKTETRNALRWLVRHMLTRGPIAADIDFKEHNRRINETVARILRCGSEYLSDDPEHKTK